MKRQYSDLIALLSRGISQRRMYFEDHPRLRECAREFTTGLVKLLDSDGRGKFFIGVANGKLVHDGQYLLGASIMGTRLQEFAGLLECGGFLFNRNLLESELLAFFSVAAARREPTESLAISRELLWSSGITSIELSPPYEDPGWFGQFLFDKQDNGSGLLDEQNADDDLVTTFQNLYDTVESAHEAGHSGRGLNLGGAQETSEMLLKAARGEVQDIMHMVRYPDYDSYTVGHSVRVAMFAVMVGAHLNLDDDLLTELGVAALLHDVGKSRIPTEILYKPGRLDERERTIMEEHSRLGAEILLETPGTSDLAVAAAWGHHRRHDKTGYPRMPLGSQENPVTHLINVCDVYEALTAIRPYKKAHTSRKAYEIMLADEGWFNPWALRAFSEAVGLYPAGSVVILSSGHQAEVLGPGTEFDRPRVRLTHDARGLELNDEGRLEVDLSTHPSRVGVQEQLILA